MRLYNEPPPSSAAPPPESRVPTAALTHALAEIEARRARQAFEQAGPVTLAEALEQVWGGREADAAQVAKQKRRQRLRLILRAELASALLCGLTLLALSRPVSNPQRQAQHQGEQVQDLLMLTQGPDPRYTLFAVSDMDSHATGTQTYSLSILPDGSNIHYESDLDAVGPTRFELRPMTARPGADNVWVFHDGLCYRRGWVRTSDIPSVLHGRPFRYYPEPVDDPQDHHAGLTPLTLSRRSMAEANFDVLFVPATGYNSLVFTAGPPVQLDEHAWERY